MPEDYARAYATGMHDRFRYLATWFPSIQLRLGDVGVFQGGLFQKLTTLSALGIEFAEATSTVSFVLRHASHASIKVSSHGGASAAVANADIEASFERAGGFVIESGQCTESSIEDRLRLQQTLRASCEMKAWNRGWSVVDRLVTSTRLRVLVATTANSRIAGKGRSAGATGPLPNVATVAEATFAAESAGVLDFRLHNGVTPLFGASRLSAFRRVLGPVPGAEPATHVDESVLEENVTDDMFELSQ